MKRLLKYLTIATIYEIVVMSKKVLFEKNKYMSH